MMFGKKQNHTQAHTSSASVVDGKMILSCPHALNPVLWQMDLTQARASALEIQGAAHKEGEMTTGESFLLVLKTPRGENVEIARFALREHALDALMAAARALENAQGQIRAGAAGDAFHLDADHAAALKGTAANAAHHAPRKSVWPGVLATILVLLLLVGVLGFLSPRPPASLEPAAGTAAPQQQTGQAPSGVPVTADDFLNAR